MTSDVDGCSPTFVAPLEDAFILIAGDRKKAECGAKQVSHRARLALEGIPEETRKMLEEGSTAYMRPLPGAARMYPETDVFPVAITGALWDAVGVPELLSDLAVRFETEYGLDAALAHQVAYSENLPLFRAAVDPRDKADDIGARHEPGHHQVPADGGGRRGI